MWYLCRKILSSWRFFSLNKNHVFEKNEVDYKVDKGEVSQLLLLSFISHLVFSLLLPFPYLLYCIEIHA